MTAIKMTPEEHLIIYGLLLVESCNEDQPDIVKSSIASLLLKFEKEARNAKDNQRDN